MQIALGQAPVDSFSGVYSGQMTLSDETPRTLPLSVSLVLTNQDENVPTGNGVFELRKVIDGAFVVDGEGGPFAFSKVTLDPNTAKIDMRYNRLRQDTTPSAPSSFRLIGVMQANNILEGNVSSGLRGIIGKFRIQRTNVTGLSTITKYVGRWEGKVKYNDGYTTAALLRLQATNGTNTNPPELELDYTPGRIGSMEIDGVQYPFSSVTIDYLRRKMTLTHSVPQSGTLLSFLMTIVPSRSALAGAMNSSNWGQTAECSLIKVSQ